MKNLRKPQQQSRSRKKSAMAMLDSAAEFEARATEVGILDAELTKLKAMRFHTFKRLAFASNYVPGQSDDGPH